MEPATPYSLLEHQSTSSVIICTTQIAFHLVSFPVCVNVDSTTANTISLSWSVPSDSVVDSYEVMWVSSTTIGDGSTSYTITGVEAEANYTITVEGKECQSVAK